MRIRVRSLRPWRIDLVRGRGRDEMGEALEGDAVAILQIFRNGFRQALELRHDASPKSSYCEQMFYMRYRMDGFACDVNRRRRMALPEAEDGLTGPNRATSSVPFRRAST